ncbi:hypothetical protein, partial [Paraburkholderia caledonica]|uniref:hypothetical protein n=1 Tax=Paraburkholderia caledonica TaxID=134536 RepID=UPI00211B2E31
MDYVVAVADPVPESAMCRRAPWRAVSNTHKLEVPAWLVERRTGCSKEHRIDVLRLQPAAFVRRHVGGELLPA